MSSSIDEIARKAVTELHVLCKCCNRPMTETALAEKYGVPRMRLRKAFARLGLRHNGGGDATE